MERSKQSRRAMKGLAAAGAAGVALVATAGPAFAAFDANGNLYNENGGCIAKIQNGSFPPKVLLINSPYGGKAYDVFSYGKGYCRTRSAFSGADFNIQQLVNGNWVTVAHTHDGADVQDTWENIGFLYDSGAPCAGFRMQTRVFKGGTPNPVVTIESDPAYAGKC